MDGLAAPGARCNGAGSITSRVQITEADERAEAAMVIAERTRPVEALFAYTEEPGSVAEAGVRQEDGVAVRGVHLIAFHAALCGPDHGAVLLSSLNSSSVGHAPRRAELLCGGGVVGRVENGLVVADEVAGGVIPDGVGHAVGEGVFVMYFDSDLPSCIHL